MAAVPAGSSVVIVGGGIIGSSIAHYLAKRGLKPIIVEKCGVACHSSGKAGGFLALDWNSGAVDALSRVSFSLHRDLAEEFGAEKIGYRAMTCIGCGFGGSALKGASAEQAWLDKTNGSFRPMGTRQSVAQVNPRKLTEAFVESAVSKGGQLVNDRVVGVKLGDGRVSAVLTEHGGEMPCDAVVIAMGPWSQEASKWFPEAGLPSSTVSHKYTSVVWDTVTDDTAVFLESNNSVEIYPRPDHVYACGCPEDALPLPDDPKAIVPGEKQASIVKAEGGQCSSILANASVSVTQACYLPGSDDGMPVIGGIPTAANGYIACGHTCWGILNAPATGKAVAELIADGKASSVDLGPFQPGPGREGRGCPQQ